MIDINLSKPIKLLIDANFCPQEIGEFYFSVMGKLKETYKLSSIDEIIPETVFCADMILEFNIKHGYTWERMGASEIYKFGEMTINMDLQNPGYDPSSTTYSIYHRYLIMSQTSDMARDHYGPHFLEDTLKHLNIYRSFLCINVYNSENGIKEFLEEKIL